MQTNSTRVGSRSGAAFGAEEDVTETLSHVVSPPMHSRELVRRRVGTRPGARLVAVAALVLGAAGAVLLVWSIISSPVLAIVLALLSLGFIALIFLAVTTEGRRRKLAALAAAAVALALIAVYVIWNVGQDGWRFTGLFGLVALALSGVANRYALTAPTVSLDELLYVHDGPRVAQHPVLIINLKSGGGKAEQFELVTVCREHGIETRVLERGDDLTDLANDAIRDGADAIGMAGGDGSLAYVAKAAVEHDVPFVCVPAGTRNHFALDLGLDRNDPRQALGAFINGEERKIDYATVNGRMFLNNVSLGVYAAIVEQDSYRDAKLDTALQLLPKLVSEGGPWFDLHFDVPDHGHLDAAAILQVSNNPYASGEFGRRGRLDAGELGMVTADPKRLADLVNLTMLAAARKAEKSSALWIWAAPTFRVESGEPEQSAGLDGETVSLPTPLEFAVAPAGLRVLVPRGSRLGLDEQRLGPGGTVSSLVSVALGLSSGDT
jgi:diacylglycerol kinase family enzyme